MKITGKHRADFAGISVRVNNSNNGHTALLDLDIGIDAEDCAKEWGEEIRQIAFGTMHESTDDDTGEVCFNTLLDSVKPGKRAVYEHHDVEVEGIKTRCQPEITSIKITAGKPHATVRVRLHFELPEIAKLIQHRSKHPAAMLGVEFNPAQLGLGFTTTKANGNGAKPQETQDAEEPEEEQDAALRPAPMFDDDGNEVEANA